MSPTYPIRLLPTEISLNLLVFLLSPHQSPLPSSSSLRHPQHQHQNQHHHQHHHLMLPNPPQSPTLLRSSFSSLATLSSSSQFSPSTHYQLFMPLVSASPLQSPPTLAPYAASFQENQTSALSATAARNNLIEPSISFSAISSNWHALYDLVGYGAPPPPS